MPDGFDAATGEVIAISDYQTSAQVNELFAALAKAQGEIKNAAKGADNSHFKSKYADLASISDACRPALAKNGIAVVQIPHNDGKDIGITTLLGHSSGQWISGRIKVAPVKWDAQSIGSVCTYLRRYSLAAMTGVAPDDDDDGEAAVGRGTGNGRAEMAPPSSSPAKPNGTRKAAPKIAPEDENWRHLANEIKDAIDAHTTLKGLNEELILRGESLTSPDPKEGSELAAIKAASDTAFAFLIDRANKRRAALANAPKEAA